jgi:hypothetical protein
MRFSAMIRVQAGTTARPLSTRTIVYWSPEGVESLKAGAVTAALLALYGFGQPFWHAIIRDVVSRSARRR